MDTIAFAQLPLVTRLASLLVYFLAWVAFAEFIIDRHGWDRFLPLYKVGNLCPYDLAVLVVLGGAWFLLHR